MLNFEWWWLLLNTNGTPATFVIKAQVSTFALCQYLKNKKIKK